MSGPLLSIIVPVYGVEKYLRECLDSFFEQNVPETDYEVICVDDGSPDRCGEILDESALRHKNLSVVHQQNAGVSAARNRGLDLAGGKYVWFVDSDDFIAANVLGEITAFLRESQCDQLRVLPTLFHDGEPFDCRSAVPPENVSAKVKDYLITRILRKEIIDAVGLRFNPKICYQEDNVFYTTLFPHLKKRESFTGKIAYFYRERPGSLSRGGVRTERILSSYIAGSVDMLHMVETDGENYNGYAYVLYMFMTSVMKIVSGLPKEERKAYLKELKEKKLFPLRYDRRYTVRTGKENDSFRKKIKRRIYSLAYTRCGFRVLRLFQRTGVL